MEVFAIIPPFSCSRWLRINASGRDKAKAHVKGLLAGWLATRLCKMPRGTRASHATLA